MKIQDQIKLKGRLQVFLNDEKVVDDANMIVDTGKAWAASMLGGQGQVVSKMKVGNNSSPPDLLQTTLLGDILADLPLTNPGGDVYVNTIEYIATAQVGVAVGPVQEVGLFTGQNLMVARKAFPVVNKGVTDIMSFIWTLTVI